VERGGAVRFLTKIYPMRYGMGTTVCTCRHGCIVVGTRTSLMNENLKQVLSLIDHHFYVGEILIHKRPNFNPYAPSADCFVPLARTGWYRKLRFWSKKGPLMMFANLGASFI
jgi:hypothetical protein